MEKSSFLIQQDFWHGFWNMSHSKLVLLLLLPVFDGVNMQLSPLFVAYSNLLKSSLACGLGCSMNWPGLFVMLIAALIINYILACLIIAVERRLKRSGINTFRPSPFHLLLLMVPVVVNRPRCPLCGPYRLEIQTLAQSFLSNLEKIGYPSYRQSSVFVADPFIDTLSAAIIAFVVGSLLIAFIRWLLKTRSVAPSDS